MSLPSRPKGVAVKLGHHIKLKCLNHFNWGLSCGARTVVLLGFVVQNVSVSTSEVALGRRRWVGLGALDLLLRYTRSFKNTPLI